MTIVRRMGSKDSQMSNLIMDVTEEILRDEGISALTSRNITDRIDANQRLVFYYFETMDELIIETFRRMSKRELERLQIALNSKQSLRELWKILEVTLDTKLVSEYVTIANRMEDLKKEVQAHILHVRKLHIEVISRIMNNHNRNGRTASAAAIAMLATSAALAMHREAEIGVTLGHSDVMDLITDFIDRHDPAE